MKIHKTIKYATMLSIGTILALFYYGCSHQVSPVTKQTNLPTSITDWHEPGFANSSNPFDYIGAIHNQGLNYVALNLHGHSTDTLYPAADTLAILYLDSVVGISADSLASQLHTVRYEISHLDSLPSDLPYGLIAQADIQSIDSIILNFTNLDTAISAIETIETSCLTSLSGSEQQEVLVGAAIARYSLSYWTSSDTLNWLGKVSYHRAIVYGAHRKGSEQIFVHSVYDMDTEGDFYDALGEQVSANASRDCIGAMGGILGGGGWFGGMIAGLVTSCT